MERKTDLQIIAYQLTQVGLEPKHYEYHIRLEALTRTIIITDDNGIFLVHASDGKKVLMGQLTTDIYKAIRLAIQYAGE